MLVFAIALLSLLYGETILIKVFQQLLAHSATVVALTLTVLLVSE